MELWIIFAILSALFAGLYSFILKIVAEKNLDPVRVSLWAAYVAIIFSGIAFFVVQPTFVEWPLIAALAFVNAIGYYIAVITRIYSLRYIHTTIYFPIYKTLGPILGTIVGIYIFKDQLSIYEMIGIALGIVVPLLLISKSENAIQNNLKKGLLLLLVGAVLTVVTAMASKYIRINELNSFLYLFLTYIFTAGAALLNMAKHKREKKEVVYNSKNFFLFSFFAGITMLGGFYSFLAALSGDFSVVFTINAFSIIIPIVLSVGFFKEHMNFRKGFVIALSVVSITFFAF